MKKFIAFLSVILILSFSGCVPLTDDPSSDTYDINSSDFDYVYQDDTQAVDDVVAQLESEINAMVEAGEATVSTNTSVYVIYDYEDEYYGTNETGKYNAIIDSDVNSDKAVKIAEADIDENNDNLFYYSNLSEPQKRIYRIMLTASEQMTKGLFLLGKPSDLQQRFNDIVIAFRALSSDNPQIFWLPNSYIISSDGKKLAFSHKNIDYTFSKKQKKSAEDKLDKVISQLITEVESLDAFEKEVYLHDWVCKNVTYCKDESDNIYTSYGALVEGIAVCEGYSRAMQLLCNRAGVPCTVIYGQGVQNGSSVGHMWNIVRFGSDWYHVDVTWNDKENNTIDYSYFNVTDSQIKSDHKIFNTVVDGKSYIGEDRFNICSYTCTSDEYNYFKKKKLIFDYNNENITQIIENANAKGHNKIKLLYTGNKDDCGFILNQINVKLFENKTGIWLEKYTISDNMVTVWW